MLSRVVAASLLFASVAARAAEPDLGPNVFVLKPGMSTSEMQGRIDEVYASQEHSEFGSGRFAFLLMPGSYKLDIPIGFYTTVAGLGDSPDDVRVTGNVHADASLPNNNATCTFWRGAEGFSVTPTEHGTLRWATSQAVFFRRMHVLGDMVLHQNHGWASGGWMSDTRVDGTVDSGSQQQWISRNVAWGRWTGSNWNMVFVGVRNPPAQDWPAPPYTKVAETPVVREKPFLHVTAGREWSVRVPAVTHNSVAYSWVAGSTPGRDVPLSHFYIARPEAHTEEINKALAAGKNLLLTPGTYTLDAPLHISRKDTVVLGLGLATLMPVHGTEAMVVDDVDGVTVSGVLFDAGPKPSRSLLHIGNGANTTRHADDPVSLHDVFFRVGGAATGKVKANLVIDGNDVLVDHTWIWRADHGTGVGWGENTSDNGLIVNGNDVTIYGLFVEHHQQFQVVWNGERGRTYFYQSEIPYDPPAQAAWRSGPELNGWASYKVADRVKEHQAFGLGVYSVFRHPDVVLSRAIEAPTTPAVHFEHMITVALDNLGEITHIIDDSGSAATTHQPRVDPKLTQYPPASAR